MVRAGTANRAVFRVDGLDPRMVYTVSAWVMADKPGRAAGMRVLDADEGLVAEKHIRRAGRGSQWNEWARIQLPFTPKSPTVQIELHDRPSTPNTILYWDFVELESIYPLSADR